MNRANNVHESERWGGIRRASHHHMKENNREGELREREREREREQEK